MINEIKLIVENYLNTVKPCNIMLGTVTADEIQINDRFTIPLELVQGNLKKIIMPGDRVRLLRNHGGQQFFVLEVIENDT